MRKFVLAGVALLGITTAAGAADMPVKAPVKAMPVCGWWGEFGGRFVASTGTTQYDLYRIPPDSLISRLTYHDLDGYGGEVFGRIDDDCTGFFVKGHAGWGKLNKGRLQDEDFPPGIPGGVYSSTDSDQDGGRNRYVTVDAGWSFWRNSWFRLGGFVGYHHYYEYLNAYGCTQTAGNPAICAPGAVAPGTLVISQETKWNALRVGVSGVWQIADALRLSAEAAWIPYAWLDAKDWHWLRIGTDFNGPTPQDGKGYGVQLEAVLSYNVTPAFAVGVGGRYSRIETKDREATTHFEVSAIGGGLPQATTYITERYGVFVQGSYTFGGPVRASY
jgi:opacity protein-like surface antigen